MKYMTSGDIHRMFKQEDERYLSISSAISGL